MGCGAVEVGLGRGWRWGWGYLDGCLVFRVNENKVLHEQHAYDSGL